MGVKCTVSPGLSVAGCGRSRSNSDIVVVPRSRQPPGESRGYTADH